MDSETTDITDDLNEFTDKAAKNEKNWRHDEEFIKTGFRKIKSLCLRNVCAMRITVWKLQQFTLKNPFEKIS